MGPGIGRSIQAGFRTTNASWAVMGLFAVVWVAVISLVMIGVVLTRPPQEALRPEAAPEATVIPKPAAATETEATGTEATSTAAVKEPAPESQATATSAAATRAERERLAEEWFKRSWPMLLMCFLLLMAANLLTSAGQIGYLVRAIREGRAPVSECWTSGARAFGPLLGGLLLWALGLGLFALCAGLVSVLISVSSKVLPSAATAVLSVLLVLASFAALVWVGVQLSLWFVAIVADRLGPVKGLAASLRAIKGNWWRMAGLAFLLVLISGGVWAVCGIPGWLGGFAGDATGAALSIVGSLLRLASSIYFGFVTIAALIRFYEDTKSPSAPSAGASASA